jgi:hypothetical protein
MFSTGVVARDSSGGRLVLGDGSGGKEVLRTGFPTTGVEG